MSKKLLFNFNREVIQNYTYVKYVGAIITATNTLEKPIKSAILKGSTKYRDVDTRDILDTFDKTKNLELLSVKMPTLKIQNDNFFNVKEGELVIGRMGGNGVTNTTNQYGVVLREDVFLDAIPNKYCWLFTTSTRNIGELFFYDENYVFISKVSQYSLTPKNARYMKFTHSTNYLATQADIDLVLNEARMGYFNSWNPNPKYEQINIHKSNILTVNEDVELRGIGDVQDTLDLLTGEVTQRIGEVVLDGSENWAVDKDVFNNNTYRFILTIGNMIRKNWHDTITQEQFVKSNVFRSLDLRVEAYNLDTEHLTGWDFSRIVLGINKAKLSENSVNALKTYLQQNPITVQYQLATESVKTVDLSILDQNENKVSSISSFNDTTHITASSETIPPIFEGYLATKEVE